jgi:hypothetical protein
MTKTEQIEKEFGALCISRIAQHIRRAFIKLAIDNKMTQGQLLTLIFNNYQNLSVEFSKQESSIIEQAKEIAPGTLKKKIRKGVLRYANDIINLKDLPAASVVDISMKNSAKAADVRADALIAKIFEHNNHAANWYDKILLTKSSVLDYVEKQKTLEPEVICIGKLVLDRCLERNKELIKHHHEQHKLKNNHNTIAYYERLKIAKGDKL